MKSHNILNALTRVVASALLLISGAVIIGAQQTSPEQPQVLKAVAPLYPVIALAAESSGIVIVEVRVDARGVVADVRSIDGPKLLYKAAENSARRWVFAPTDERAKARVVNLTFVFKIVPKNAPSDELLPIFKPPYYVEIKEARKTLIHRVDADPPGYVKPSESPRNNLISLNPDTANNLQDDIRYKVFEAINLPFPDEADQTRTQLIALGPMAAPFIVEFITIHERLHPIKKSFLIGVMAAINDTEVDNGLLALSDFNDSYVRGLAVTQMGKRKVKASIPYLIKRLDDMGVYLTISQSDPATHQDILVRDEAVEALKAITGMALAEERSRDEQVKAWLRWWHKLQKSQTAKAESLDKP